MTQQNKDKSFPNSSEMKLFAVAFIKSGGLDEIIRGVSNCFKNQQPLDSGFSMPGEND